MRVKLPLVAVFLLLFFGMSVFCQTTSAKTAPEIRELMKLAESKDVKISDAARDELSKLTADSIPGLFEIVKKDGPCSATAAAGAITKFNPTYPGLIPAITQLIRGATPSSIVHWEEDGVCRRTAAFLLPRSAEGLRVILSLLRTGNIWEKQAAVFALDDFTEVDAYMDRPGEVDVMMEIVPALAKLQKSNDEVVSGMSNEVLGQISRGPAEKLANLAKKLLL